LSKKKVSFDAPRYLQLLSDLVENWENTLFGTIIYLKDPELPQVLVQYKPLPFSMDAKIQLSCEVIFPFNEKLDQQKIETYRAFSGMSCKLSWVHQKIFTREPKFVSSDIINQLKSRIPNFRVDYSLSDSLNCNERIKNLIKKNKPDDLNITAILMSSRSEKTIAQEETQKQSMQDILINTLVDSYYNPNSVVWTVSVAKLLYLSNQRKDLIGMCNILKTLSNYLVEFTKNKII